MPDKFTYVKRGYDIVEVDTYVSQLEEVIKSYKEKDAAIKNAIINAQIAADNIVKNARFEAEEIKRKTADELEFICLSTVKQKDLLKNFQDDYERLLSKYLKPVEQSELIPIYSKINDLEEYLLGLSNKVKKDNNQAGDIDYTQPFKDDYNIPETEDKTEQ